MGVPLGAVGRPKKDHKGENHQKGQGGKVEKCFKKPIFVGVWLVCCFFEGEVDFEAADNRIWPMFFLGVYGFADPNGRQSYGDLALLVYDKLRIE